MTMKTRVTEIAAWMAIVIQLLSGLEMLRIAMRFVKPCLKATRAWIERLSRCALRFPVFIIIRKGLHKELRDSLHGSLE
jgi:hypothetical protein